MRLDLHTGTFVDTGLRPNHDAVIGADRTLTWQALAQEAAAWCVQARAAGFAADVPVIIRGHKEAAFFVAIAGALMLGAPFVPLDTIYPDERMGRIALLLSGGLDIRRQRVDRGQMLGNFRGRHTHTKLHFNSHHDFDCQYGIDQPHFDQRRVGFDRAQYDVLDKRLYIGQQGFGLSHDRVGQNWK